MSITNIHGIYSLICDVCGDSHPDSFSEFYEAVQAKKDDGWRSRRQNGDWEDVCPECQRAELDEFKKI